MFKTFQDIERVAAKGKPDAVLDTIITSYLQGEALRDDYRATLAEDEDYTDEGFQTWLDSEREGEDWTPPEVSDEDVAAFRREHYAMLRAGAYPPSALYLDAVAKGDDAQVEAYRTACLAVKERFPK